MIGRWATDSRPVRRTARADPEDGVAASADAAHAAALHLLTARARTRAELERRLQQRGFEPGAIAETLDRLAAVGLIDDDALARDLAASRAAQGVDASVIAVELRDRGVDPAVAVGAAESAAPAEEREERCREVARGHLAKLQGVSPQARFRRLAAYLTRRGYPPDVVEAVVSELVDLSHP
ncbi:MAG TPA: regulatory protein RecX [Actinomycetes bacterium]|jgi:regulatory protein|nr:regulatory protein RecX [Actinomycetes bacterium]